MISTREAQLEPISTAVFERMSKATGGKAYFARSWSDEKKAFPFIQEDLAHLYSLSYYPQPNPSTGWRTITVKLVGKDVQKYHIRTRAGYRLQQAHAAATNSMELVETQPVQKKQLRLDVCEQVWLVHHQSCRLLQGHVFRLGL